MSPRGWLPLFSLLFAADLYAQSGIIRRDTAMINRSSNPLLANFRFRSIGPASMGGRIDDVAVYEKDPRIIWIGYAVGGVFKSTNAGTTFVPVFEQYGSASIGDIALDQNNPDIAYVGTGEPNNRQTSSFGDGIYKTTDGGKTFTHAGLREVQTIARVVLHPQNSNIVYVASPGHLFGPNPDRGIYKSTDGGRSWTKVKYVDENTGFTDLAIDPSNPNVLYAASYQRRRTGCCFNGGGPGSALWKSEDAGRTWTKLTGGLPPGTYGRIAVDVARSNPNIVYAQIETDGGDSASVVLGGGRGGGYDWCNNAGPNRGFAGNAPPSDTLKPPAASRARPGIYRSENKGRSWTLVSNCNGRPMYFSNIRIDPTNANVLYVSNVRAAKSLDGGKTFITIDEGLGWGNQTVDQHAYWINPANPNHIMRGSDAGFAVSWDQGATWDYIRTMATGLAYWVTADMNRPYNVYSGLQDNDVWGGPSATRSRIGIRDHNWYRASFENSGDGFQTAVDPTDRHMIYTEAQDGRTVRTDLSTGRTVSIRPVPPPATEQPAAPAAGSCIDGRITGPGAAGGRGGGGGGGGRGGGTPNVVNGLPGEAYRFNWNTPILLSPHNPRTIWMGGNRLFRSDNQGDMWTASLDLTRQVDRCKITVMGAAGTTQQLSKNDGMSSFSTIITISESRAMAGVVWAGTDDGMVQVSRDNGATFTEVGKNITGLPDGALDGGNPYWIARIDASHFDPATAYVAVDGHRSNDLKPYVYVTRDYGRTWTKITNGLPEYGNLQVVREDPKNPNLLYAGTEFGLFVSLDGGRNWEKFMNNYPTVRTDDILVHPRDGDLIVATHGRSIWIADDITPLQQLTPSVAAADAHLFDVRPAVAYIPDIRLDVSTGGEKQFEGENPQRGTAIQFHIKSGVTGDAKVAITDPSGRALCETTMSARPGIHRVQWTLVTPMLTAGGRGGRGGGGGAAGGAPAAAPQGAGPAPNVSCAAAAGGRGGGSGGAAPGSYIAKLSIGGKEYVKPVTVLEDRWKDK